MEPEGNHNIMDEVHPETDGKAIQEVINKVKSQGLFDQLRKECLTDVDTKPAYHNLIQRVEKFVEKFLSGQNWSANVNKNQLRESLRRQLNNSGVMTIGVERIIEQVVNPKILLGIKPKIDEAVCEHLGIDLKARQEERQRRKQEHQNFMVQQQQHFQNLTSPESDFSLHNRPQAPPGAPPWPPVSSPMNLPRHPFPPDMASSKAGMPVAPFSPHGMGFGGIPQPMGFMSGWPTGLPGMEGFNPAMPNMMPGHPMIPGQPMIPPFGGGQPPSSLYGSGSPAAGSASVSDSSAPAPAQSTPSRSVPDLSKPPPNVVGTNASSTMSSPAGPMMPHQSSPIAPPGIVAPSVGPVMRLPPPGSVPPPPGTVPVSPLVSSMAAPVSSSSHVPPPSTPTIPALISHTLSKVSQDDLTPEKIAVFKTAAAFITKTVNNAQATPGADLASMFSPRVLAEAMMEETGKPMTKHEIRAARRKERMKEFERLKAERDKEESEKKAEDKEDPLPPKANLMDVFQGAEDVSDDDEALDMLMDVEEAAENPHKQGIVLSDSDKEGEDQPPTSVPGKRYNFAWDVDKDSEISDASVSSIHTSDISSFEDSSSSESESENEKLNEAKETTDVGVSEAGLTQESLEEPATEATAKVLEVPGQAHASDANLDKDATLEMSAVNVDSETLQKDSSVKISADSNTSEQSTVGKEETIRATLEESSEITTVGPADGIVEASTGNKVEISAEVNAEKPKEATGTLMSQDLLEVSAEMSNDDKANEVRDEQDIVTEVMSKVCAEPNKAEELPTDVDTGTAKEEPPPTSPGFQKVTTEDGADNLAVESVPLPDPITVCSASDPKVKAESILEKSSVEQTKKPRKLVSLSYRYSDSDEEETREERKMRIAKEKEERYLKRQQRRAEMELKKRGREEEKARLKEERKKLKELKQSSSQEDIKSQSTTTEVSAAEDACSSTGVLSVEQESPNKASPKKKKNKAELKEQLLQQKVMERKAALRRSRTRNRKYVSEEFTSIFSQHKHLNQSYTSSAASTDIVTFDGTVEVVEMTVDQECVVETVVTEENTSTKDDLNLQCRSPYSDISDRSMSESDDKKEAVEMEEVSSDEDLGVDEVGDDGEADKPENVETSPPPTNIMDEDKVNKVELKDSTGSLDMSRTSPASRTRSQSNVSLESGETSQASCEMKGPVPNDGTTEQYDEDDSSKPVTGNAQVMSPTSLTPDTKQAKEGTSSVSDPDEKSHQSSHTSHAASLLEPKTEEAETPPVEESPAVSEPKDIMANLDLEPVSDEDSPFGDFGTDKESTDGEAEDEQDTEQNRMAETKPAAKVENKQRPSKESEIDPDVSDEGEIKSDSDEAEKEEEKERQARRKPIELVDFGEAAKRAREARTSYYPESSDRRSAMTRSSVTVPPVASSAYRKGYPSWNITDPGMHSSYSPHAMRYGTSHDKASPAHGKSPMGSSYDGLESEASSHSRSSVRLRDDAPLPYPIEGLSHKHHSPGSDKASFSTFKKRTSPSPVSPSSTSSGSRSSSPRRTRSRSNSSSSPSSSRRSHNSKKSARRRKRRERGSKGTSLSSHSSSKRLSVLEKNASPIKTYGEIPVIPLEPQKPSVDLSSGNESISSDELPYFPDEEAVTTPVLPKRKRSLDEHKSSSSESSTSSSKKRRKRKESPGKDSISSSDLIYSPTRLNSLAPEKATEKEEDEQSIERPPMSPAGSSISSGEFPNYHATLDRTGFSPHRPVSPSELPPLPEDIDGFQPPLPDESPPFPHDQPPLPPLPPDPPRDAPAPPPEPIITSKPNSGLLDTSELKEQEEGEVSDESENATLTAKQHISDKASSHNRFAPTQPFLDKEPTESESISQHEPKKLAAEESAAKASPNSDLEQSSHSTLSIPKSGEEQTILPTVDVRERQNENVVISNASCSDISETASLQQKENVSEEKQQKLLPSEGEMQKNFHTCKYGVNEENVRDGGVLLPGDDLESEKDVTEFASAPVTDICSGHSEKQATGSASSPGPPATQSKGSDDMDLTVKRDELPEDKIVQSGALSLNETTSVGAEDCVKEETQLSVKSIEHSTIGNESISKSVTEKDIEVSEGPVVLGLEKHTSPSALKHTNSSELEAGDSPHSQTGQNTANSEMEAQSSSGFSKTAVDTEAKVEVKSPPVAEGNVDLPCSSLVQPRPAEETRDISSLTRKRKHSANDSSPVASPRDNTETTQADPKRLRMDSASDVDATAPLPPSPNNQPS
ncbi:biorientation of chromosomes in cell division protein 1-like protein [Plakobranchus ocellatus]|uniref:Biorientation of chromosomes in cell division protein 1-like protein n=1 Tax=Plakobranchus ocellatus TaxID=259542 RepID=A0AAV4E1T1_9GAST|nr:biorientation of chromosomes in cell division protein 1-like protein [Plakobranchus ocellatus]